ncbi:O-acyltransferase like protein-like [Diadema antillarum]|uniref:O-acyltransferase like protein-like n=1 Tax=Diadema antillarum TaxID=105358 RepID=UPI003A84A770
MVGRLSLLTLGVLLACSFGVVLGQLHPDLNRFLRLQRAGQLSDDELVRDFQRSVTKYGLDFDETLDLLTNKQKFLERQNEKIAEFRRNSRVVDYPTGRRFYVFADEAVSQQCLDDVERYETDLANRVWYATIMADSEGQPNLRQSLRTFNFKYPGNVWLCKSVKKNGTFAAPFDAKYCYTRTPFGQDLTGEGANYLGYGTCWPATCTQDEINTLSQKSWAIALTNRTYVVDCQEPEPWRTADIAFLTLLSFFALLVCIGTFYEIYLQVLVLGRIEELRCDNKYRFDDEVHADKGKQDPPVIVIAKATKAVGSEKSIDEDPDDDNDRDSALTSSSEEIDQQSSSADDRSEDDGVVNEGFKSDEDTSVHPRKTVTIEEFDVEQPTSGGNKSIARRWELLDGVLISFSMVTNCKKIFSAKKTKNTMASLNGIRVLSMLWVILGHTVAFYIGRFENPRQLFDMYQEYGFWAIIKGDISVDTFFILSGFLVTFLTLKALDGQKLRTGYEWAVFYFHRWWRLTPVYMVAMGMNALMFPHFGQGLWRDEMNEFTRSFCRKYWWTHPLYVNNLVPFDASTEDTCFGLSWYLANDMQFFIISPIIIVLLHKKGKAGMALITSIMLVSLGALFGINWYWGLTINGTEPYNDRVIEPPNRDLTYSKPYTRIPTYLVGMVLGYIMFKLKGKKPKIHVFFVLLGWCVSFTTLYCVVYGQAWSVDYYLTIPQAEAVMYLTFNRVAWGVGIAWMMFACLTGYGGPIAVFLEWKFWIPLARLSYCTYLIHASICYAKVFSDQILWHVTPIAISYVFTANTVFSYMAAIVLCLLVEAPTMGLEKVMFGAYKSPKLKKN